MCVCVRERHTHIDRTTDKQSGKKVKKTPKNVVKKHRETDRKKETEKDRNKSK